MVSRVTVTICRPGIPFVSPGFTYGAAGLHDTSQIPSQLCDKSGHLGRMGMG